MSDWQKNAVHFIDLINGHSRGQSLPIQVLSFLPISSVLIKPSSAYAVLMRGFVNDMRHKTLLFHPRVNKKS